MRLHTGGHASALAEDWGSSASFLVACMQVIRFLGSAVERIPASISVYADDIAIATAQSIEAGRRLLRVFDVAGPGVGIVVNAEKTQVVACYAQVAAEVTEELCAIEAHLAEVSVVGAARHLGVPVGPLAAVGAWGGESRLVAEWSRRPESAGRSPLEHMVVYQSYTAPVAGHRLQFRPPDLRLRIVEETALATISALPMRAIPASSEFGLRFV